MTNVNRDFADRVNEINLYFDFMENIIIKNGKLQYPDATVQVISTDLVKIFKANSFLILYNLSESCIKNSVEEIYNTIYATNVSYDKLKEGLKREIISFLKKNINAQDFASSINEIANDIILKCFDTERLFSGNLDAREIRKLATNYGFSYSVVPIANPDGTFTNLDSGDLLTVKSQRNDLAHGTFSFKDCGKNYTIQDLIKIKNHVIEYLRQILKNIETYITNSEYLAVVTV